MTAAELDRALVDHVYEEILKPRIPAATAAARQHAPPYRDLKAETVVWLGAKSDDDVALVHVRCDSKQPDVVRKNKRVVYARGVDLANITNGPKGTHTGWWDRATRSAFAVMLRGS